jgi:Transposase DNA-binding/Transposase Tn5 dimerisation domain
MRFAPPFEVVLEPAKLTEGRVMSQGLAAELTGVDLGDQRLNRRCQKVIEQLGANPEASINAACGEWHDTLAAYRLFSNDAVTPEKIRAPHVALTRQRVAAHPVVLVIQDTTEIDLSAHPPQDAQHLDQEYRRGFYEHVSLAVTPQGLPLGVVGSQSFARSSGSLGKAKERKALPLEEKESYRWLEGYRLAIELAEACPSTQIVSVSDRESDLYDIFVEAQQRPNADYLVRSKVDRCIPERDPAEGVDGYRKVRAEVAGSAVRVERVLELGATPKRAARTAKLEIRALTLTLKPPHARPSLPPVTCQVVLAEEVEGPGDGSDVSWLLITSLPIGTQEEVLRVVDYYRARWVIEVYFRVLKTGCRVERSKLESVRRVQNALAFYQIIAWRLLSITHLNRQTPEAPCTVVFAQDEWKAVWQVAAKKPLPAQPPPLGKFIRLLAQLGGYNNRAKDPPPGPQVLWNALRRMIDFTLAWQAFQQSGARTCV